MPEWRKLHVKIKDSEDVNEMPDDFTRLLWMMFFITLDKEGRGIYKASWIRSNALPLREDVPSEQIMGAMQWYASHELIRVYTVGNRKYFDIPTWHDHQNTSREAESVLPSLEEGTQDLVETNSRPCIAPEKEKEKEKEKDTEKEKELAAKKTSPQRHPSKPQSDPRSKHPAIQAFREIIRRYPNLDLFERVIEVLGDCPNKPKAKACRVEWLARGYNSNSIGWLEWYRDGVPPRNGHVPAKPAADLPEWSPT